MRDRYLKVAALTVAAIAAIFIVSCGTSFTPMTEPPGEGFQALFNGTDFTGWNFTGYKIEDTPWEVANGNMHCKGGPQVPYLILTEKEYENFEFYAEFKVSKDCNSGIFYHVPEAGRQSKLGFETQILDDSSKAPDKNSTGSIYDVVPPLVNAMKRPGKWNRYHVIFDWPSCKVWLNDQLVQDTDFQKNKELRYRMRRGPLGLSNHGYEVEYRNLWIKELPDTDTGASVFNGNDLSGWQNVGNADWHVENGMIVSTHGEGFIVTEKEYERVYFHAYADNDTLRSRESCFYYRWQSPENPGYPVDMYDFIEAKTFTAQYGDKIPPDVIAPMKSGWFLYRIVSADRESKAWLNEFTVSENKLLGKPPKGKIAIYRGPDDGIVRLKGLVLRELEGPGI